MRNSGKKSLLGQPSGLSRTVRYTIATFYIYGAAVHVTNMIGLSGFDWLSAPLKWQMLDGAYLILNTVIVIGLLANRFFGVLCFFVAALSQVFLYTIGRSWVLDVPPELLLDHGNSAYLWVLVVFHIVSLSIVTARRGVAF